MGQCRELPALRAGLRARHDLRARARRRHSRARRHLGASHGQPRRPRHGRYRRRRPDQLLDQHRAAPRHLVGLQRLARQCPDGELPRGGRWPRCRNRPQSGIFQGLEQRRNRLPQQQVPRRVAVSGEGSQHPAPLRQQPHDLDVAVGAQLLALRGRPKWRLRGAAELPEHLERTRRRPQHAAELQPGQLRGQGRRPVHGVDGTLLRHRLRERLRYGARWRR